MSFDFQTSSGTCLAHSGTAEVGKENPDMAFLILSTSSAFEQDLEFDQNQ